jgi:hypothetical protein
MVISPPSGSQQVAEEPETFATGKPDWLAQ